MACRHGSRAAILLCCMESLNPKFSPSQTDKGDIRIDQRLLFKAQHHSEPAGRLLTQTDGGVLQFFCKATRMHIIRGHRTLMQRMPEIFLIFVLAGGTAAAAPSPGVQKLFLTAEKAIKKGHTDTYRKLKAQLRDYPLYPYLLFEEYRRKLRVIRPEQVEQFLSRYADSPLAGRLRRKYLDMLAREENWPLFHRFYQPTTDTRLDCHYRHLLITQGRIAEALQGVEKLWLVGHSQPRACDSIFAEWIKAGGLTPQRVWERIELAMAGNQRELARYLQRYVPEAERKWVKAWLEVHSNPQRALTHPTLRMDHPRRDDILVHAVKRTVWKDTDAAIALWEAITRQYALSPAAKHAGQQKIGLVLAKKRRPEALLWLSTLDPALASPSARQWRVRAALRAGNWRAVLSAIDALTVEQQRESRWIYWRARALEALGFEREAEAVYASLAERRDYHGFLSADRLQRPYHFQNQPLLYTPGELRSIEEIIGMQRAKELFQLNRITDARREWRQVTRHFDPEQLRRAAKIAQKWGWYSRAIFTAAQSRYWDDVPLRFPMGHQSIVLEQARHNAIEAAWIFGIMRQESAFMTDARSSAGALGLMQLMPATGQLVARQLNTRLSSPYQLLVADRNISFGSKYLRVVRDKFYGHPVLATAAYNAGYNRVKRWLPKKQTLPADIWIETIPFDETRDYLERVMAYTTIYEWRLDDVDPKLAKFMRPVAPFRELVSQNRSSSGQPLPDS